MKLVIKQTGPMPVNTYILKDESSKDAVLIDVGGDFEMIKNDLSLQNYNIKFILNTHAHFDHILGEIYVKHNYPNLPIYLHKADLPHIKNIKQEMHYFNCSFDTSNFSLNDFIDETSNLFIGDNQIKIIYTPGHSKGSLSFFIDNMLFCGDTLFYRSIGRTDFYDGNFDTLISSIKNKLFLLPDNTLVYPGHGIATTIKDEKLYNPYLT